MNSFVNTEKRLIESVDQQKSKLNETMVLFILAAINFTHIMDFVIMAPLNPFFKEVFNINTKQFGLLLSVYTLSAGIAGFLGSFFIDKVDRKTALMALYSGFIISNVFCALADTYYFLMGARVVAGAFGGVLGALVLSVIGDAIPPERRGRATGIVMAAFSAASIVGIPAGLFLANKYGWYAPFLLISILGVLVFVVGLIYFPPMKGHLVDQNKKASFEHLGLIFGNPNLRWSLLFTVLLMMSGFTVVPFISDYFVNNVGIPKEDLGFIYLFGGLATVVTGPLIGKIADKHGKQRVFLITASISIIPMLVITNLPKLGESIVFTISTIFFVFFGGRFIPAMALVTSSVEAKKRGSFMSINSSFQQLAASAASVGSGMVIANTSSGALVNFNYVGIFAAVLTVFCILASFKIKPVA